MFEAYGKYWSGYVDFSGRSSRTDYWYAVLANVIISAVLGLLSLLAPELGVLSRLYSLAVLIPSVALSVRRLHDIGKSGAYFLLVLIPLAGPIIMLVFTLTRGVYGCNRFGADPYDK